MTCDQIRAYLDTTLPEERSNQMMQQIQTHTRDCPDCAKYLAEMADLERRLGELPAIAADAMVLPAVMHKVQQAAQSPSGEWAGEMLRVVALAAGVMICVAAYYGRVASGQWLSQVVSLHTGPAGLTSGLLQQPLLFTTLCGVGTLLAAAAILWQSSSAEPQSADLP